MSPERIKSDHTCPRATLGDLFELWVPGSRKEQSMSPEPRLPLLPPEQLDPDQAALYREITGGPRATGPQPFPLAGPDGGLLGPFNAMLLNPALGTPLQALGAALRYRGSLPDRSRELAILLVAADRDSRFEQVAHESVGRQVGLTEAELTALRRGPACTHELASELAGELAGELALTDPLERAVLEATAALLTGDLTDQQYARLVPILTAPVLFELVCLVGYYATLALSLRVFGADRAPS
jgi:4-carboxymuconolactone decarboxylase